MYDQVRYELQQAPRVHGTSQLRLRQEQLQLQTRPGVQVRGEKGKPNLDSTVWKFTNFSATQILREIKVGKLAVLEIAILTI